ncbi:GNAT family N-acetyltransferase [Caenimonas terrae]|uniref:GNAT family N-acetyltransferase n=1 Tax=Caenimonas terrae TaxID=696074 RepID=A0ABW0N842_9BURK
MDDYTFSDNKAGQRYELMQDGALAAHADYQLEDGAVVLTHTNVLPGNEGKGVGSRLARLVLQDLRQRGVKIVPQCEFMAGYIAKHPAA